MTSKIILNKRKIRKLKLYRFYGIDLFNFLKKKEGKNWSIVKKLQVKSKISYDKKLSNILKVNELEMQRPKRWSSTYMQAFINKKVFYTFFYNITYYDVRKHARKSKKRKAFAVNFFILFLETRLDTILYRSQFFSSVYMIRQFILHGHIMINNFCARAYSHRVKFFDIVSIKDSKKLIVFNNLQDRLKLGKKAFDFSIPRYLEVSYKTLSVMFLPKPRLSFNNVFYPNKLDIEQIMHSYKKSQK